MITARYRPRPPCRAVSRQTTLGSRPIRSAITRLRPARRFPGATPPGRRVVRPERSRIPCLVQLALEQPVDSAVDPLAPVTTLDDGGVSGGSRHDHLNRSASRPPSPAGVGPRNRGSPGLPEGPPNHAYAKPTPTRSSSGFLVLPAVMPVGVVAVPDRPAAVLVSRSVSWPGRRAFDPNPRVSHWVDLEMSLVIFLMGLFEWWACC